MPISIVTPATNDPVTLAEFKAHERITHTEEDGVIAKKLSAATQFVQAIADRQLVDATLKEVFECWPSKRLIHLGRPPVDSVSSVKYYDTSATPTLTTMSTDDYRVYTFQDQPGILEIDEATVLPDLDDRIYPIEVTFVAGYGAQAAVPEIYKEALHLVAADYFNNREDGEYRLLDRTRRRAEALVGAKAWGSYA